MNPSGLEIVASDSLLAADPIKVAQPGEGGEQGDGLKVYDDVDIRSPRADQTANSQIDKLG